MKLLFKVLLTFFCTFSFAQNSKLINIQDFKNLTDNEEKWELLFNKIDYFINTKKDKDSISKYLNLLILKDIKGKDSLFIANKIHKIGVLNSINSNYDLSIANFKTAILIYEKYNAPYKSAVVKRELGDIHQLLFNNKEALFYLNQVEEILKGEDKIRCLISLGAVHAQMDNLDQSIKYYNKALSLSNKTSSTLKPLNGEDYLYNIYNGMAVVYNKNKDTQKTKEVLKKALNIVTKKSNYAGQVICLYNLGTHHFYNKEYQISESLFKQAIQLFDKIDHNFIKGMIYLKYAEIKLNTGNTNQANIFLNKSEQIFSNMKNTGRMPMVLHIRAAIELKKGQKQKAIATLKKAISMPVSNKIIHIRAKNYFALANVYKETNNAKKSFEAFENFVNITDSITNRKKTQEIENVKIKFEIHKIEQNLKLKEQDLVLLSAKNKSSNYRNLLLGLLSTGLLFFLYRQRKLNKTRRKTLLQEKEIIALNESLLKDRMKSKNSQITKYAIHIDERNKFLDTITEQIKDISSLSTNNNQKNKIHQLQYYIKDNISVQKGKVDLDKDIKNTEQKFRFNLEQKFPKLTEKEIVVCKLLSLDLSSKQIAQKMEITLQSVNNYRASIRKKTKLAPGDNLKRFLKHL